MKAVMLLVAAGLTFVGSSETRAWEGSEWISVKGAPVAGDAEKKRQRAADGTSCFRRRVVNAKAVKSAKWTTAGLGVYELYLNGRRVGADFLKPGFTHYAKTKISFAYDVTALMRTDAGADKVMKRFKIPTVDLYAPIAADPAKYHSADGTHFNGEGVKVLAKAVADAVTHELEGKVLSQHNER